MMRAYKKYFTRALAHNYPQNAGYLISETDRHFATIAMDISFAANSKNPIDKRLEFCGYFLALIMALDEAGEEFAQVRLVCLEVVLDYVRPKNKVQAFLKRLPAKLVNTWFAKGILRQFQKRVEHNENPAGFVAKIITDKDETYGFGYGIDILECGICKLFAKHHFSKYASILCEVDEVTSSLAGLKLIRSGTIANGSKKCDFRFRKEV
jgi:hypothetical protein